MTSADSGVVWQQSYNAHDRTLRSAVRVWCLNTYGRALRSPRRTRWSREKRDRVAGLDRSLHGREGESPTVIEA
jgi:hypothetical protein